MLYYCFLFVLLLLCLYYCFVFVILSLCLYDIIICPWFPFHSVSNLSTPPYGGLQTLVKESIQEIFISNNSPSPNSLWESAVLRSWALRKVILSSEEWRRIPRAAFYIRDKWLKRRGYRGWVFIETRWLVKMSFYWRQKTGCKCEFFLSFFCWCLLVGGRMGPTNSTPQTHPLSFIHHLPNIVP